MTKLTWTRVDRQARSLDYMTPLPQSIEVDYLDATHILRWYNAQERSWVVSYSDARGAQVGASQYVATKDESLMEASRLYSEAAAWRPVCCRVGGYAKPDVDDVKRCGPCWDDYNIDNDIYSEADAAFDASIGQGF